jgi:type VI secretion system secreted protein Hcp
MAFDTYVTFNDSLGKPLQGESQVVFNLQKESPLGQTLKPGVVFEIDDFSFDIEQVLNIGSQSSGLGAGRVTFNPFSITRKIDRASPTLFDMACSGQAFKQVGLALRKSGNNTQASGIVFLRFDFKLVGVKTISWSHDDESPKETVTFAYGGILIRYCQQNPNGSLNAAIPGGWNMINNKQDHTTNPIGS